jgi:hypothetical protein
MVPKLILLMLTMTAAADAMAQEQTPVNVTWKDSARHYIKSLKDGALVVRMQTRAKAVEQLTSAGNTDAAKRISMEQRSENLDLITSFKQAFTFCRVYFIFADSTEAWLSGKRTGYFLNDSLVIDPGIVMREAFSLLVEEGSTSRPVASDDFNSSTQRNERGYLNSAIILYDQKLRQLKAPFPGYAQEPFPQNLTASNRLVKVETLNKKLFRFYKKSLATQQKKA